MTVTTRTGRTVTLVGRGENISFDDIVYPTFADSDGHSYLLTTSDDASTLWCLVGNTLMFNGAYDYQNLGLTEDDLIDACFKDVEHPCPQAILFAVRCGLSLNPLHLPFQVTDNRDWVTSVNCVDGMLVISGYESSNVAFFSDEFAVDDTLSGYVSCDLQSLVQGIPSLYMELHEDDYSSYKNASGTAWFYYLLALGMKNINEI